MHEPPPPAVPGPPPFQFAPRTAATVRGAAFSVAFKLLATGVVGGCAGWLVRLWSQGRLGEGVSVNLAWFLGALVLMAWTWWAIVRSVTTLDTRGLHQTWLWDKRMPFDDLAYARLLHVRGLEWLVAPRLYVRTLMGKFAVFYAADPRLTAECERLVQELREFRALR